MKTFFLACPCQTTLLTHPYFLHERLGWHLPYSLLLMFNLLSRSEELAFSCLFLDIRAAAVQTVPSRFTAMLSTSTLVLLFASHGLFLSLLNGPQLRVALLSVGFQRLLCTKEMKYNPFFSLAVCCTLAF